MTAGRNITTFCPAQQVLSELSANATAEFRRVVLFSHPEDYTPVCTTELGAFAKLEPEFAKRNVKLIGLSANTIESHGGWIKDIDEISGSNLRFPIIGDKQRKVALLYDM